MNGELMEAFLSDKSPARYGQEPLQPVGSVRTIGDIKMMSDQDEVGDQSQRKE